MLPAPPRPELKGASASRPRRSAMSFSWSADSWASSILSRLGSREGERMLPAPPRPEWVAWGQCEVLGWWQGEEGEGKEGEEGREGVSEEGAACALTALTALAQTTPIKR